MRIIKPIEVTDTILLSSSITEDDYTEWSSATAYVVGDFCMVAAEHKIYECAANSTNNDPTDADNIYDEDESTGYWIDKGATNRWKMFDQKTGTVSSDSESIVFSLQPNVLFNSIAFFNVAADSINVTVESDSVEVYNVDINMLELSGINDYYQWCFSPLSKKKEAVLIDLPAFVEGIITVTITNTDDTAELGACIIGVNKTLGAIHYNTSVGLLDYSVKTFDEYGNAEIEERGYSKKIDYAVGFYTSRMADIQNTLAQYRATPIVYIGKPDEPATIVYGFFRDFSLLYDGFKRSTGTISVEGLT